MTVLLASHTLYDVILVDPGRFYLYDFVLQCRYVLYIFVVVCSFQVHKEQGYGFFSESMLSIYYTSDVVAQVREILADFFSICGVMKIFDDYSVCSFLFELICVVEYIVFFYVLDEFSVCFRCRTI